MNDSRLRAALGYPKFKSAPRVLLFDTQYLVINDVIAASEDMGWSVFRLPTPKTGVGSSQYVAQLLTSLVSHKPDLVLTINHLGFDENGELGKLLTEYGIPVASWFVDNPLGILGASTKNATPLVQLFCFEREAFPWLRRNGYEDPVHLPTGSVSRFFNPDAVGPELVAKYRCRLSLAANSWWQKARVEPSKPVRKAARLIANRHSFSRENITEIFEKIIEQQDAKSLAAAKVALAEASMKTRQQFVSRFLGHSLKLYGDSYWKKICPAVQLSPYLDYHSELPALFMGSEVNLNITAEQMPTAVNQRVWDVPAVGGFLITDAQQDALEVFVDGESMVFFRSLEEAVEKVDYYLTHPTERDAIAQRGRAIVDANHRMHHRLARMYQVMKQRFG